MTGKSLGKITDVKYGYDSDYMSFGLQLVLETVDGGCFKSVSHDKMKELLKDSKVNTIDKLIMKPIEVEWERSMLKDFRILTEVL